MEKWLSLGALSLLMACAPAEEGQQEANIIHPDAPAALTEVLEIYDVSDLNEGLVPDMPTADIAFYVTESGPAAWESFRGGIERAQLIFAESGVQLRVSQAMLIRVPEAWQSIEPFEIDEPTEPLMDPDDLYARLNARKARLNERTTEIVSTIVSHYQTPENGVPVENAIHVISLDEVPIPYFDWDGEAWNYKTAGTSGMSFPPYYFADRIPADIRGFISMSSSGGTRTLAHELGHKLINVSHEGGETCPAFTAYGQHLMLYGSGEEIGAGREGRFQRERLQLSPFLHRDVDGEAVFDNHYEDGGIYRDSLYGDFAIERPCEQ